MKKCEQYQALFSKCENCEEAHNLKMNHHQA